MADDSMKGISDVLSAEVAPERARAQRLAVVSDAFASEYRSDIIEHAVERLARQINADLYRVDPNIPKPPPLTRWQRWRLAVQRWVWAKRERLGEIIAGRRFDDGSDW